MYIHTHRSRPTRGRIMAEKPWTDASSASANSSLRWTMFEWVCVCACVRVCVCVCGKQWVKWSAGGLHSLGDVCKEPFFDCCCCWLQFEEVRTRTPQKAKTARPISAQTRVDHPWINRIDRQGCWLGDWGVSNPQHDNNGVAWILRAGGGRGSRRPTVDDRDDRRRRRRLGELLLTLSGLLMFKWAAFDMIVAVVKART